jgi:hypothetical protein
MAVTLRRHWPEIAPKWAQHDRMLTLLWTAVKGRGIVVIAVDSLVFWVKVTSPIEPTYCATPYRLSHYYDDAISDPPGTPHPCDNLSLEELRRADADAGREKP